MFYDALLMSLKACVSLEPIYKSDLFGYESFPFLCPAEAVCAETRATIQVTSTVTGWTSGKLPPMAKKALDNIAVR